MNRLLTKSAEAVQAVLDEIGLVCKVLELPSSTRTASDAASTIGCDISQIIKSLIFKTKQYYCKKRNNLYKRQKDFRNYRI